VTASQFGFKFYRFGHEFMLPCEDICVNGDPFRLTTL